MWRAIAVVRRAELADAPPPRLTRVLNLKERKEEEEIVLATRLFNGSFDVTSFLLAYASPHT